MVPGERPSLRPSSGLGFVGPPPYGQSLRPLGRDTHPSVATLRLLGRLLCCAEPYERPDAAQLEALARRLLTHEARAGENAEGTATAGERVHQKIFARLASLFGAAGAGAHYMRGVVMGSCDGFSRASWSTLRDRARQPAAPRPMGKTDAIVGRPLMRLCRRGSAVARLGKGGPKGLGSRRPGQGCLFGDDEPRASNAAQCGPRVVHDAASRNQRTFAPPPTRRGCT